MDGIKIPGSNTSHLYWIAKWVNHTPTMQETRVRSQGLEDPPEEEMAAHSSILARTIPWTEEPGGLQSMWSHKAGHNCAPTSKQAHPHS